MKRQPKYTFKNLNNSNGQEQLWRFPVHKPGIDEIQRFLSKFIGSLSLLYALRFELAIGQAGAIQNIQSMLKRKIAALFASKARIPFPQCPNVSSRKSIRTQPRRY